jgi:membrane protein YdbS with pleckstrin-like domain
MSRKTSVTQFNCFSPPIMLVTFCIEIVLAAYTLIRYKLDTLGRLSVLMLLALAAFQLCEYHVCGGWGVRASEWSRAGYVAITLLPALGLHMLYVLAGKPGRRLVMAAYISMLAFVAYFTVVPHVFRGYACTGNYVIFQIGDRPAIAYGAYYYGWILTAIVLGVRWSWKLRDKGKKAESRMFAMQALVLGYLIFLVPTALANSVKPETRRGIPSIMCGFAVLFALLLALYILPKLGRRRIASKT